MGMAPAAAKRQVEAAIRRSRIVDGEFNTMDLSALARDGFCETVLETVGALVVVLDHEGHIIGFNRASEVLSGYSFDEVRGKPFFDLLLAPEDVDKVRAAFSRLQPDMFPVEAEYDWITRTGERRHIIWNNAAMLGDSGAVAFVVGTGIDVTERRNVERQIEQAKREWECTFDSVPDLIAVVGMDFKVIRVNQAMADRLGCQPGDVVGRGCCEALHGLRHEPDWCLHKQMLNGGTLQREDVREEKLDGDYQITVTPLRDREGTLQGSVHVFRDLSAVKEADAARRREELARRDRMRSLGLLSSALAHELSQPLTGILSNAQAALRFLEQEQVNLDEIRASLEDIAEDSQRTGRIISGLRTVLAEEHALVESVYPAAMIRDTVALIQHDPTSRPVKIEVCVPEDLPPVMASAVQLQQVFLNLLFNAIESMEGVPDELLHIRIRAEADPGETTIRFTVHDNGPGVPTSRMQAIFEPFQTDKPRGMGMGLAICRSIVGAFKGQLDVTNHPEGGAVFRVILPVAQDAEVHTAESAVGG